jgi:DnaJ-class molecular chaperone
MDIFDLFSGGGRGRSQRERKSDDVRHNLQVSLEELYNGVTK